MKQTEGKKQQGSFKKKPHGYCVHLNGSTEVTKAWWDPRLGELVVSTRCDSALRAPFPGSVLRDHG